MATAKGFKATLLMDTETTFGTTPSPTAAKKLFFNTFGLGASQNVIDPGTIQPVRSAPKPARGNIDVSGAIAVPVDAIMFGYWLRALFEAPSTADQRTSGNVVGGSVTASITVFSSVTDGSMKVSLTSIAVSIFSISFATLTGMDSVAAQLQSVTRNIGSAGFQSCTVVWNSTTVAFTLTSGKTGLSSTIQAVTSCASGTDITGTGYTNLRNGTLTQGLDIYQHTFTIPSVQRSFTIEKGFTDITQYLLYNGCKATTLALPLGGDGELVATVNWIGKSETHNSVSFDAASTQPAFVRLENFQAGVYEAGASCAIAVDGDINYDSGLEGTYLVGTGGTRGDITEGIATANGALNALFQSGALLTKAIEGTESSLQVIFYKTNQYSLSFYVDELEYARKSPNVEGKAGIQIALDWRAFYDDDADASLFKVVLKNNVSSYAF